VVPYIPTGLVIAPDDGQAHLAWQACAGAMGYEIKRSTKAGPMVSVANNVAATSYTNTGLSNGDTYMYVISAANSAGRSRDGAPVSVVVGTPQAPSPAPAELSAMAGDRRIVVRWKAVPGASTYNVKRSETAGGPYQIVAGDLCVTRLTPLGTTGHPFDLLDMRAAHSVVA
jgi:cellulose 1,4-beta-cellobiosidase